MKATRRLKLDDVAEINMTSLLDIVFIVLIFFIVVASYAREVGIEPNVPEPDVIVEFPRDATSLQIQINEANKIKVDGRYVLADSISAIAKQYMTENPKGQIQIVPAPNSEHGVMIEVYDAVVVSGALPNQIVLARKN